MTRTVHIKRPYWRRPGVRRVTLLVREVGTAVPYEQRTYCAVAETQAHARALCEHLARSKGLEVGQPS